VLLLCLPLLRPLRHPDPRLVSDDEQARLGTVQAIVERKTLAIEATGFRSTRDKIAVGRHLYSNQPPMLALLLSGPYWVMHRLGLTLDNDPAWAAFWLTLLGVTLPVALSAGLVYRMGRLFELRRTLRAVLGLAVVLGSGLISYATTLNAHAPAAALLLSAAACLFHTTLIKEPRRGLAWLGLTGLCAALAACIDPPASVFLLLLIPVIGALHWPVVGRVAGVLVYALGAVAPVLVHAAAVKPITGDWKPGLFHPELAARSNSAPPIVARSFDDEEDEPPTAWRLAGRRVLRIASSFFGSHGIFSHFPVMLIGIVGVSLVMHRHWPSTTKILAGATLAGAVIVIYSLIRTDMREAMFATRWFIAFLPLVLFWSGVWLRRPHGQAAWIAACVLLAFSTIVSIIGATGPFPREGFDRYTVVGALHNLRTRPQAPQMPPILADRLTADGWGNE
jgi:hypothetical protein